MLKNSLLRETLISTNNFKEPHVEPILYTPNDRQRHTLFVKSTDLKESYRY